MDRMGTRHNYSRICLCVCRKAASGTARGSWVESARRHYSPCTDYSGVGILGIPRSSSRRGRLAWMQMLIYSSLSSLHAKRKTCDACGRGGNRTHRGQCYCPPHGFEGRDRHQTTSASAYRIPPDFPFVKGASIGPAQPPKVIDPDSTDSLLTPWPNSNCHHRYSS
jgi:hypothetical protein